MIANQNKRLQLADVLGFLAEQIIRRSPPYDIVPLQPEMNTYLNKYLRYFNEVDESLKEGFVCYVIASAKEQIEILLDVHRGREPFASRYRDLIDAKETFLNWIKQREVPRDPLPLEDSPFAEKDIKVNQLVKQVMKERVSEFSYDKSTSFHGHISFSKSWLGDNKLYIGVDRGSKSRALTFYLGLYDPEFFIDIATFFGGGQSRYWYETSAEVISGMNKGLDVINILLPHFMERVEKVLTDRR